MVKYGNIGNNDGSNMVEYGNIGNDDGSNMVIW